MRPGEIWVNNSLAGILTEGDNDYSFEYEKTYLEDENAIQISVTLPLQKEPFKSEQLFPFFDGLIPEGCLLDIAHKNWKLSPRDRMGLLLTTCKDCIGNISIIEKV